MKRPFVLVIVAAAMACGPADTVSGSAAPPGGPPDGGAADGGSGAAPAVVITSPPDGANLALDDHGDDHLFLDVVVELRNVRVAADCGSESSCGVLAVFVDDDACGSPNASTSQGNGARVDFARCGQNIDRTHRLRADVLRGSTLVARSPEIQVTVRRNDDHGDGGDGDDHGGDDHGDDRGDGDSRR